MQSELALPEIPVKAVEVETTEVSYTRTTKPRAERSIPAGTFKDIPVKQTIVIMPEEVKANPDAYVQIGEERTFEIDIVAPQLFKREIVRPKYKYVADGSKAPVIAAALEPAIMVSYASAGLWAWIALSKYVNHQPIYRLEKRSERWGAKIPMAKEAVKVAGIPYKKLKESVWTSSDKLSICTMHFAKGLEFRAVVVMACDDEILPLQERIEEIGDSGDLQEVYDTERHLLYVACTRARDFLLVSGVVPASEFIEDFR